MSWRETLHDAAGGVVVAAVTTATGGILWVVRGILTNRKQIEILRNDLAAREELRDEMRKADRETVASVRDLLNQHRAESIESNHAIRDRLDQLIDQR